MHLVAVAATVVDVVTDVRVVTEVIVVTVVAVRQNSSTQFLNRLNTRCSFDNIIIDRDLRSECSLTSGYRGHLNQYTATNNIQRGNNAAHILITFTRKMNGEMDKKMTQ